MPDKSLDIELPETVDLLLVELRDQHGALSPGWADIDVEALLAEETVEIAKASSYRDQGKREK